MEFYIHTLPNGIRCILKRIKSPVAYCAMTVGAGSRDELTPEHGIAHFTEHSLFKGTRHRRSYHINNRLEKLGGELNAFTTKEETVIHATTLKTDIAKAVELMADVLFHSVFPAREIEKEREVVLDEINSYKDSPAERIYDEFEDMLFCGSPLGHNILGSKKTVAKFTGDDISRFTGRCYNTDRMVFSVAANISESRFVALAERFFGGEPANIRPYSRPAPVTNGAFSKTVRRNTYQAHCILGGLAYGNTDPKRVPLSLLLNTLGGPAANSILNTLLREKNGLTYGIEASYNAYQDCGVAAVYFGTDKGNADRCFSLVGNVLEKVRTDGLSPRQLSMAKKQLVGQLSIAMEAKEGYMLSAAKSLLVYGEVDSAETMYRKIMDVTPAQLTEVAQEVLTTTSSLIYN